MKIDFSYLVSDKFLLCENNILFTIENILAEKSKFSIFGKYPNEDGEGFFTIEQVHVLNAVFDVPENTVCKPKIRGWDNSEEDIGEKFDKKISVLFILLNPVSKGMRSTKIFYTADIRLRGFVSYEKLLYVQKVSVDRDEMVPGYGGVIIPDDYRKYLSDNIISIYREIQIAKNNGLKSAVALLTQRFIDAFLAEVYGAPAALTFMEKLELITDSKIKKVIEFPFKNSSPFIKCITREKIVGISEDDVEKMADFIHILIENYLSPKKIADLEDKTEFILNTVKS